ncbi:MAG: fimbrillin family protein [Prevotella sp.]|nr:fimbrillin family protein [Prevotella sp.]
MQKRIMDDKVLDAVSKFLAVVSTVMITVSLLVSCSLVDEDTSACNHAAGSRSGSAIAFIVSDSTASTRTAEGTMTLDGAGGTESLRELGFGVFAAHTGIHRYASSTVTPNLMYNQQVVYDGATGIWDYAPIVYWPAGEDGNESYVSFFAYAPYSDGSADDERDCITDFSLATETGDPWLVYRLGGTEQADGATGWKACQQDLLYAFAKDQTRGEGAAQTVALDFRHALAAIGDRLTLSCDATVEQRLRSYYTSSPVSLTVSTVTVDYELTPKGRLVLNNAGEANWQAIGSGDSKVHRRLAFTPGLVMAEATSSTACTTHDYTSPDGNGLFYIPLEAGSGRQQVTVTADYAIASEDPTEIIGDGTATVTADLSYVHSASEGRDLSVGFRLPDETCGGTALHLATTGMVVCSHGRAHEATTGNLDCGGTKVAVIVYRGTDAGVASYSNGLALSMADVDATVWTAAADAAAGYTFDASLVAGAHPVRTSRWFLPTAAQWNLLARALTGATADLGDEPNALFTAESLSAVLTAAGGAALSAAAYWTSTAVDADQAVGIDLTAGCTVGTAKTAAALLRPVLAF